MEVRIQSIHFDADQKLLDLIKTKLEKVTKFDADMQEAAVYLKLDAAHETATGGFHSKIVEIKLIRPGKTMMSKAQAGTFEDALEAALDTALVQVRKHRDIEKG